MIVYNVSVLCFAIVSIIFISYGSNALTSKIKNIGHTNCVVSVLAAIHGAALTIYRYLKSIYL